MRDEELFQKVCRIAEDMRGELGRGVTVEEATREADKRGAFTEEEKREMQLSAIEEYLRKTFPGVCAS